MLLSLCWACPVAAQVQPSRDGSPFVVEGHLGFDDPLGSFGMALVYDRGYRFSAGVGLGLDSVAGESLLTASLFARARLFREGVFALDVGAILSRGGYTTERDYYPPDTAVSYPGERLISTWMPDYRATGTLAAELANRRWSLRLEVGLGYHLNRPTCRYEGSGIDFTGDCNSPVIPDAYHFALVPGQISPSLSLTAGYRLGVEEPPSVAEASAEYRSPSMALRLSVLSTAIPSLLGATMVSMWFSSRHHDNNTLLAGGLVGLGLGLGFGPSIGYAYSGEHLRAWGGGLLRLIGVGAGALAVTIAGIESSCDDCSGGGGSSDMASLGIVLFCATAISTIYDVATAPRAAQRANARHGIDSLSLVPVPIRDPTSSRPGLALLGQF